MVEGTKDGIFVGMEVSVKVGIFELGVADGVLEEGVLVSPAVGIMVGALEINIVGCTVGC